MLRLNIRRGDSTWRFGRPQWGIVDGPDLFPTQAAARLYGKRVLALISGYNVKDPTEAYKVLAKLIGDLYDEIVFIYWPNAELEIAFWTAQLRAPKAGRIIAECFAGIECAVLDFEGHSLGCRVALEALLQGLRVRNLILAGAAVDNEVLAVDCRFGWASANALRILVAHSRHDEVLARAGRLGLWDNPLGLNGPERGRRYLPHVLTLDCAESVKQHSAYKGDTTTFLPAWRAIA